MTKRLFHRLVMVVIASVWMHAGEGVAAQDTVCRQITYDREIIWITDLLDIGESFAMRESDLWNIYQQKRDADTNLIGSVITLLKRDDLKIEKFESSMTNNRLKIKIQSRLQLEDGNSFAKLRWVCTLGGKKIGIGGATIGKEGDEILFFKNKRQIIFWFPEFGPASTYVEDMQNVNEVFRDMLKEDSEYSCILNTKQPEYLFHWLPNSETKKVEDANFLKRLHQVRSLSFNDFLGLYTNMKIAKGGYYQLNPTRQP